MITKQEAIDAILSFRNSKRAFASTPIQNIMLNADTAEKAYLQIGRGSSDCMSEYNDIAFREDLYDLLIAQGFDEKIADRIMLRVRTGLAHKLNFEELSIDSSLKNWCLGVRYLPPRKIIVDQIPNYLTKEDKNMLCKDRKEFNHRSEISQNLRELADTVCKENYVTDLLSDTIEHYSHKDKHEKCDIDIKGSGKVTEKRICCCWNYYNKNIHPEKCADCNFKFIKKNIGKIKILDYESPTPFKIKGLGGMDWLLDYNGEKIAAEVKPPNSSETIVRMIAEILTYTIDTPYTPAICFFKTEKTGMKLSKQCSDYLKYKDNQDFITIKNKTGLKILYVTFDDDSFEIHDVEKKPIVC